MGSSKADQRSSYVSVAMTVAAIPKYRKHRLKVHWKRLRCTLDRRIMERGQY